MKNRPYFNKSIKELEKIFKNNQTNEEILKLLQHELNNRTVPRALALKRQVLSATEKSANKTSSKKVEPSANAAAGQQQPALPLVHLPTQPGRSDGGASHPRNAAGAASGPGGGAAVGAGTIERPFEPAGSARTAARPVARPPVTNDAQDILRAWTALEVLSPQGYRRESDLAAGDGKKIARFEDRPLPWETGEKSIPGKRLYYELFLGAMELAPAVEALLKVYADKRPDRPGVMGHGAIASVLLDKEGRPLEEDTGAAISSFAWGVPVALQGDLKKLADWPLQEKALMAAFRRLLIRRDRNDEIIPLTKRHIKELFDHLVFALNLHGHAIRAPYFALRRYEFFASKTPPEPSLLNSFFLEDLSAARDLAEKGALPSALQHYLGIRKPPQRTDLLNDNPGLQDLLQPALTPPGKWPGKGRFPLALLQQAAVNATHGTRIGTGILAVNGPPGTGKTTLLRDVVAARLIERATVMSEYADPSKAFTPSAQSLQRNGAKITLHRLDPRLKGFEMIVASSNNKAVENVSAELPALEAIAADAPGLRYFKTVSDNVLERDTWGIIAAVLGNSSNRYQFSQGFWRDQENGFSTYLNHASGMPQTVSVPQEGGRPPVKRNREIVDRERPPANRREAQALWEKARAEFQATLESFRRTQARLQELHVKLVRLVAVMAGIDDLSSKLPAFDAQARAIMNELAAARPPLQDAEALLGAARRALADHFTRRPGFFSRLCRTRLYRDWQLDRQNLSGQADRHKQAFLSRKQAFETLQSSLAAARRRIEQSRLELEALGGEKAALEASLRDARLGAPMPDAGFFASGHEDIQTASLWFDKAAGLERDAVFEAAIRLHRAFIGRAADPLRQNLSVFVETFGTRSLGTPQKDAMIADLWASFFLVVPVVSTTFASVHRMFSRLAPETLGWLLVDEAGQAVPQAAVGAMLRTKRSVVVGDPLQIPPVVTLPDSLTEEICAFFGIDPLKYNAPEASVQTVADAASIYCARFPIGSGHRDVGAPLLVHRRCDSPMFDISNEIAYSNLMVQAKKPSAGKALLGPSAWIDVVGRPGPDKWCADEAVVLIDMLRKLRAGGGKADLYIVTPFVIVQDNLRRELLDSGILKGWVERPDTWVFEHVGTVHTVQGREADIVFFVLGAQSNSQNGARGWAGGRPNLVNVAVTRAKTSLYVIGNRRLWKTAGVFAALDRFLPNASPGGGMR